MSLYSVEDPSKLRRIVESMLLIGADLDLPELLRKVIEEARSITGARYGAIGVLNSERTALAEFVTVGLDQETEERIGARPKGLGVLGLVITEPQPLRIPDLNSHPNRAGFPPDHPPMTSFLGVPIRVREAVYGNLYLTDKVGWSEFTSDDLLLSEALALAAGIAVENARLHEDAKATAVLSDRERVALDLHDRVIRRLFSAGLALQGIAGAVDSDMMATRLNGVISELDNTITEIRSTIFDLTAVGTPGSVRTRIVELLRDLDGIVGFEIGSTFDGPVDTEISDEVTTHLLAMLREAMTHIARYADVTEIHVLLSVHGSLCRLQISDNDRSTGGWGSLDESTELGNLRRRAEELHGHLDVSDNPGGGTTLDIQVLAN